MLDFEIQFKYFFEFAIFRLYLKRFLFLCCFDIILYYPQFPVKKLIKAYNCMYESPQLEGQQS